MKFKVGMRVKKVRGRNIGTIAIVRDFAVPSALTLRGCDMRIELLSFAWNAEGLLRPPGVTASTRSHQWEPILDSGDTAEEVRQLGADFLASLNLDADLPTPSIPERERACLFGSAPKGYRARESLAGGRR